MSAPSLTSLPLERFLNVNNAAVMDANDVTILQNMGYLNHVLSLKLVPSSWRTVGGEADKRPSFFISLFFIYSNGNKSS